MPQPDHVFNPQVAQTTTRHMSGDELDEVDGEQDEDYDGDHVEQGVHGVVSYGQGAMMDLDDRYDWYEVTTLSGESTWYRGACLHRDVAPVVDLQGAVVAGLCFTCDQQLPPVR